ncbi:MAG: 30S ribosomal protein THX [Syntrophothermus sp.]
MGKGDKKSKRGKITIGTYGARRARKKKSLRKATPVKETRAAKPKPQPVKVINQTDLEEAPVVQTSTPAEGETGDVTKNTKKTGTKKTAGESKPKTKKKTETPDESQPELL